MSALKGRWRRRPRVVIDVGVPFWLPLVGAGANMMMNGPQKLPAGDVVDALAMEMSAIGREESSPAARDG